MSEESEKRLHYLVKNTENYITFTIPTEKKVTRIDKNEEEITNKYIWKLQFIDSARFMKNSLSNLGNNLFEGIHNIKCKYGHDKNVKIPELNKNIATVFLNTQFFKKI